VEDNRFFVGLQSLTSGASSTITFNPNEGLGEVILTMELKAPTGGEGAGEGYALPAGWGYMLLRRIGYRYGSSQLYYISGQQNLLQTLALCEDSGKKQAIFNAGGQAIVTAEDWADATKRTAYVYLRLPHSSPALAGGALPFPTDVLTAPVQIQIDLQDFDRVISTSGTPVGVAPTELRSGTVNFTQVTMQDSSDLIARRFDMSKHALTIPLPEGWTQEELTFAIDNRSAGQKQISLTGCKAGDLKKLRIWFTKNLDTASGVKNPSLWVPPSSIQFAINGLIYLDSRRGSWLLTNILRRRVPPTVDYSALSAVDETYSVADTASTWVEIDLAQPYAIGNTAEVALLHGVPVMNSVLNLSGTMPLGGHQYVIHCEYVLNCSWMASRGSAEFVF
jgi:hypothetical protein